MPTLVIEGYGARAAVSASEDDLPRVVAGLPPGWRPCPPDVSPAGVAWRFSMLRAPGGGYRIRHEGAEKSCFDLDVALRVLRADLRRYVGHHARDLVFVHAGVVAHRGRAIVLPGHSFSGKSTLVAALVRRDATFFSDEYAILDERGFVHPYLEPISLRPARSPETTRSDAPPAFAREPVPIGMVALAAYTPTGAWAPRRLSAGEGALALVEHAVPARERPEHTLRILSRAVRGAIVLQGERGEADPTADALLEASQRDR